MFYTFSQNNSGGSFVHDKRRGIGEYVIIEANDLNEARNKAKTIGIYFNGVEKGEDCECCGDRWYDSPDETETPMIYGDQFLERESRFDVPSYLHKLDGSIISNERK